MNGVNVDYIKKTFAKRLKNLRESKNLSQEELASLLNISRTHIANLETAKSGLSVFLLMICANFFDCTTDYLLGRSASPKNQSPSSNDIFELMRNFNEIKFDNYEITNEEKEKIISAIKYALSIVKLSD